MSEMIKKFFAQEEAATAVEYAILLTLIVLVLAQTVVVLGSNASSTFEATANALPN